MPQINRNYKKASHASTYKKKAAVSLQHTYQLSIIITTIMQPISNTKGKDVRIYRPAMQGYSYKDHLAITP